MTIFYYHLLQVQEIIRHNREIRADSLAADHFGYDSIKQLSLKAAMIYKFYELEYTNIKVKKGTDYFKEFSNRFKKSSLQLEEKDIKNIENSMQEIARRFEAEPIKQVTLPSELPISDDSNIVTEIKEELSDKEEDLSLKFIEEIEKIKQAKDNSKNEQKAN